MDNTPNPHASGRSKTQARAELCQAQVNLKVAVEVRVEFVVEIKACHY